ncbi:MAG: CDP-diacylglycerol--glycerol-3-phosphate 3-phosphatidyltransferase [Candidatus Aminicenantes bacterium]|nr:CDP-diacylglycerol--glycerol-3-phosphate 3-phosphatidyltransferase [Candidatus Aminicenantes bacterium]
MNGPNILTLIRIVCIPAIVAVLVVPFDGHRIAAFALFAFASLTDWVDGIWARRKGKVTLLGQILDPLADKLLIASVFICLVELGLVKAWMVAVIIGRELAVSGLRAIASSRGVQIPASLLGKAKMALESWTIAFILAGPEILGPLAFLIPLGLGLTLAAAVLSGAEYFIRYGKRLLAPSS